MLFSVNHFILKNSDEDIYLWQTLEKSLAVGGGATGGSGTRRGGATRLSAWVEGRILTEREDVGSAVFLVSETPSDEVLG